jgi:hypothetical protein
MGGTLASDRLAGKGRNASAADQHGIAAIPKQAGIIEAGAMKR